MKIEKQLLLIALLFPLHVFAHGEEVLISFVLPVIPAILFFIVLSRIRLQKSKKLIVAIVYMLFVFLSFYITRNWPYNENAWTINMLVTLTPPVVSLFAFLVIRNDKKI